MMDKLIIRHYDNWNDTRATALSIHGELYILFFFGMYTIEEIKEVIDLAAQRLEKYRNGGGIPPFSLN